MSDVDNIMVTFHTQLSDVMETVVKSAMYEVTRLVEDCFLEEVKRRNLEVESLRMQLQRAERKLTLQGSKEAERAAQCADALRDDVDLSINTSEDMQDDAFLACGVKKEGDCVERWTRDSRRDVKSGSSVDSDEPTAVPSHEADSQSVEKEDVVPVVDVKEEQNKLSCSVHIGGWSATLDSEAESLSACEMMESHPELTQNNNKSESVRSHDKQISSAYVFPEDREDTQVATDPSVEMDVSWAGLTLTPAGLIHKPRPGTDADCDSTKSRGPLQQTEHELSDCVPADIQSHASIDQLSTSDSCKTQPKNAAPLTVSIKQEAVVDSDTCKFGQHVDRKAMTRSGMASLACLVKRNRASSEALKQTPHSQKAPMQEGMRLHSKTSAGFRLQTAIQHLHRPVKKSPKTLSDSSTAALSAAHSQAVNFNLLNRVPSTSKAASAPEPSGQRVGDKQTAAINRTVAPWVNNRSQHQSADTLPHPDFHPVPRHLLCCGQCGKCFPHPSNLKAHLQTHTGERPFSCSLCGRSFTKLSNLKAHRRVHTGERPYCCLACGKRFTQKCNLKRHQRIHMDG